MSDLGNLIGPDAVQFERLLPAPVDIVWDYLTVSDRVATWLAHTSIEPHVGGTSRLQWEDWSTEVPPPNGEKNWIATGVVTRWDPPHALAYTWNQPGLPQSELTFELTPQGDRTLLILTHRHIPKERHMFAAGWHAHLDLLETRLKGGDRGNFIAEYKSALQNYSPAKEL